MKNQNAKNPNNDAYWQARGYTKRPKDWQGLLRKPSKRQLNQQKHWPDDGLDGWDAMFNPLCKDDY